jgi:hypothetical protein
MTVFETVELLLVIPRARPEESAFLSPGKADFSPEGDFPVERDRDLRGVALLEMTISGVFVGVSQSRPSI